MLKITPAQKEYTIVPPAVAVVTNINNVEDVGGRLQILYFLGNLFENTQFKTKIPFVVFKHI